MKKIIPLFLAIMFVFAGCSASAETQTNGSGGDSASVQKTVPDVTITESTYVTYINDIYANTDNYKGKVIKIDGMFTYEQYNDKTYYYVYRVGPGCCGNDGSMCGLEFTTSDSKYPNYTPADTDTNDDHPWISVTGTLETYEESGNIYLTLSNATVTETTERGADTVSL